MGIKYKINSDFFETWSLSMAYVLGYIFADGSLEDAHYIRGKYLRISSADASIVRKLRKAMSSKHTIVKTISENPNRKDHYLLRVGSHKIFYDLNRLGVYPRKSLTVKFPSVPDMYLHDFIRGYFDGDGSLVLRGKYGARTYFISGSYDFLDVLSKTINSYLKVSLKSPSYWSRSYRLCYGTRESLVILNALYGNVENGLYLYRKYRRYINLLKRRKNIKN